jgi:glycosyltransferase involved in cell wall biosynthesis
VLIEAFARLAPRHPDLQLEIVGDNRTSPRLDLDALSRATGVGDRIHLRSYVPDEELGQLYGEAAAFAFLSEYEGFGFTPLEALAAGVPPVVLDTGVAREIYGAAAIYVERPDPSLVEQALERALIDPDERTRVLDAAPPVLARYSWAECARRTLNALVACAA